MKLVRTIIKGFIATAAINYLVDRFGSPEAKRARDELKDKVTSSVSGTTPRKKAARRRVAKKTAE